MRNPWPLLLPGLALYAVFTLTPILLTAVGSFVDLGAFGDGWVGLQAWRDVLGGARFWSTIGTTLKFATVLIPVTIVCALGLAVLLSQCGRGVQSFGRLALYIPGVTSPIMVSMIWRWALANDGFVNELLGTSVMFLGSNPQAFWSISMMVLSVSLGAPVVYLMAAFSMIDPSLYEAARLDGCSRTQEAVHITIPGIAPVLLFVAIERTAGTMQLWQFPYAVTGGGPNYGTTTLMLLVYQEAFQFNNLARASVMSLVLMAITGGVVYATQRLSRRRVFG